jgi:cytidine deaminase
MSAKHDLSQLHAQAVATRNHSHSPYSNHKVGAAIQLTSGEIFSGCNVENASYGGTVCAERVAIWKAVSEKGALQISDIVVVTDQKQAWPPCGFCRQVIAEFASPQTLIHIGDLKGIQRSLKFSELFPDGFTPTHLHK